MSEASALLDAAAVGREIGQLVALVLIKAEGDPEDALSILDDIDGICPPEGIHELDAPPIAAQAIREAMTLRGEQPAGGKDQ